MQNKAIWRLFLSFSNSCMRGHIVTFTYVTYVVAIYINLIYPLHHSSLSPPLHFLEQFQQLHCSISVHMYKGHPPYYVTCFLFVHYLILFNIFYTKFEVFVFFLSHHICFPYIYLAVAIYLSGLVTFATLGNIFNYLDFIIRHCVEILNYHTETHK